MLLLVVDDVDPFPKVLVLIRNGKKRVVDDAAKESGLFKLGKYANDHEDALVDDHVRDVVLLAIQKTHFQSLFHVRLDVALKLIHLLGSRSVNGCAGSVVVVVCIRIQKQQSV